MAASGHGHAPTSDQVHGIVPAPALEVLELWLDTVRGVLDPRASTGRPFPPVHWDNDRSRGKLRAYAGTRSNPMVRTTWWACLPQLRRCRTRSSELFAPFEWEDLRGDSSWDKSPT